MKVSIILASYNGATTLPATLAALSKLECPDFAAELLLVDNASTDATPQLMQDYAVRHGARCIREPRAGKSYALNTAIQQADGDLLVFTDDDVLPDAHWLAALVEASRRHPDILAFAGQIRLHWPNQPRPWLQALEQMGRTLGATPIERGEVCIPASDVKGANAAIRREALSSVSQFRTDIGVSSVGPPVAGEETAFFGEIESQGHPILFVPAAKLLHIVRPTQMSLRSLMRRGFRNGRGAASIQPEPLPPSRFRFHGLPAYAVINVLGAALAAASKALRGDSTAAACEMLRASEMAGFYWARSRPA